MVFRRRSTRRPVARRPRKMMRKKRSALPPARGGNSQIARVTETVQYNATGVVPNTNYFQQWTLGDCARAQNVALQYRYMRLDLVEIKFEPYYNVYNSGIGTGNTVPQLYWQLNRTANIVAPANGLAYMQECGIKPVKFNKDIFRKYVPNINLISAVQQPVNDNVNFSQAFQTPKKLAWLNTRTDSSSTSSEYLNKGTPWYGSEFFIDQVNAPSNNSRVTCTYHWSFKGALPPAAGEPTPA